MTLRRLLLWLLVVLPAACQAAADDVGGLVDAPPHDYAVLVTGGAFRTALAGDAGTFARAAAGDAERMGAARPADAVSAEAIPMTELVELLRRGRVFQRVAVEEDPQDRRRRRDQLRAGAQAAECQAFLQSARDAGFDLLLCVEELADGPIDAQGVNDRWPVTLATWLLLGIGMFIPDHSFESGVTLRVTLRDVQSGAVLHDPLLVGGPIDLSLVERSDLLGVVTSVLVPPFWVGDDPATVAVAVRDVLQRRLSLSLARDLKSESVRQRLRERSSAGLSRIDLPNGAGVQVDARESLSVATLRPTSGEPLPDAVVAAFERQLLGSLRRDGERFRYEAAWPRELAGRGVQVLVGTIRGGVSSATFAGRRP